MRPVEFVLRPYFFLVTHEILNKLEVLCIQHVIANELWLRAQGRLRTRRWLRSWGIISHSKCTVCSWREHCLLQGEALFSPHLSLHAAAGRAHGKCCWSESKVGSAVSYIMRRTLACPCLLLPYLLVIFLVHLTRRPSGVGICGRIFRCQLWNRETHLVKSCKMSFPKNTPGVLSGAGSEAEIASSHWLLEESLCSVYKDPTDD